MSRDLTLSMKLQADASRMTAGLLNGERGIKKFTSTAKREFDSIKSSLASVEGKFASLGVTIGVTASIMQSAKLDRELKLLKLTAGGTAEEVGKLRNELFSAQNKYGSGVDDLKAGVDSLIAGGLSMKEATLSVEPMARIMLVAKTNADSLAKAMGVASQQFKIDLNDPEQASLLLDKMLVAGREGYAEIENLPDIFARVGANAKSSNLSLEKTLALTEALSLAETNPERLGTLVDSTLRLFTNVNYMKKSQKATGVKFFDKDGSRRDAIDIVKDIKNRFDQLKTDNQKNTFIGDAFGQTDQQTLIGLRSMLDSKALTNLDAILQKINNAKGAAVQSVPDALNDAVIQIQRLKGTLREAADGFAIPINEAIANASKKLLDKKENGGLGMDGNDLLLAGGGAALVTLLTAKYGGKAISGIAGKMGGLGANIATGKMLETAAGVPSVFVVNMPDSIGGVPSVPGVPGAIPEAAKTAAGTAAGSTITAAGVGTVALAAAPLVIMYGATQMAGDTSKDKERASALLGFTEKLNKLFTYDPDKAQREWRARKDQELNGTLTVRVDADGRVTGTTLKTNQPGIKTNMANGPYMATQ